MAKSLLRQSYRALSWTLGPLLNRLLRRRAQRGKEDQVRLAERRGIASLARPTGELVWLHVASVGESLSVLPLVDKLLDHDPRLHVLVTSTTRTSGQLLAQRLPTRAFHQYAPLDHPRWVQAFMDHWRPNLALFAESELWPNLLTAACQINCPCVLINGRMSAGSFKQWQRAPGFIASLLGDFAICLVPDAEQVARFEALGAKDVRRVGNLKMLDGRRRDGGLPINSTIIDPSGRPTWLAASTHPGEEALVLDMHQRLVRRVPGLLTLIAVRHPERRDEVIELLKRRGLEFATRSSGAHLELRHELYLIDTLGELPDFYAASDVALICGSLLPGIGGHNPIEALHRDAAVLMGPHVDNFGPIATELLASNAIGQLNSVDEGAGRIEQLLTDTVLRDAQVMAAQRYLDQHSRVLDDSWGALRPFLSDSSDPQTQSQTQTQTQTQTGNVVPLRA